MNIKNSIKFFIMGGLCVTIGISSYTLDFFAQDKKRCLPTAKKFERKIVRLTKSFKIDGISGLQGLTSTANKIFVTGGYSKHNIAKIDSVYQAEIFKNIDSNNLVSLPKDIASPLFSSAVVADQELLWLPYRGREILVTNQSLELLRKFPVPTSYMVSGTYIPTLNYLLIIDRENNNLLTYEYGKKPILLRTDSLQKFGPNDFYDIDFLNDCILITNREDGIIFSGSAQELGEIGKALDLTEEISGLGRPQHAVVKDKNYYVIDSELHSIFEFDTRSGEKKQYVFDKPYSFRGLQTFDNNRFLASGFLDGIENQKHESQARFLQFSLGP